MNGVSFDFSLNQVMFFVTALFQYLLIHIHYSESK